MSSYLTRTRSPHNVFLRSAPPRRITTPQSDRLNSITTRDPSAQRSPTPDSPSFRRSLGPGGVVKMWNARNSHLGDPPRESEEEKPPSYNGGITKAGVTTVRKEEEGKNGGTRSGGVAALTDRVSRRGGWWRLLLILVVALVVIPGLVLGLALGLTKGKHHHSSSSTATNSTPPFPAGSWNFAVVLDTVTTACTPNSATWACFPYNTYAQNPSASHLVFNWIITSTSATAFTIMSTPNTFSLDFPATPLTLLDANTPNQRWSFNLPLPKQLKPNMPLGGDGITDICYFNQSTLTGVLYENVPAGANLTNVGVPIDWPGTAWVAQTSPNAPICERTTDGSQVPLAGVAPGGDCTCAWETFNVTSS